MDTIDDFQSLPAILVFPLRHGLQLDEQVVQTPRTGKPCLGSQREQVWALSQLRLGIFQRQVLHKALGADASPLGEQALKVVLAEVNLLGNGFEVRLVAVVLTQVGNGLGHLMIGRLGVWHSLHGESGL